MIFNTGFKLTDDGTAYKKIYEKMKGNLGLIPGKYRGADRDDVLVWENPDNGNIGAYRVHFSDRKTLEMFGTGKSYDHDEILLSYWDNRERVTEGVIMADPMKEAIGIVKDIAGENAVVASSVSAVYLKRELMKKYHGK
jgi:hypothetical protein